MSHFMTLGVFLWIDPLSEHVIHVKFYSVSWSVSCLFWTLFELFDYKVAYKGNFLCSLIINRKLRYILASFFKNIICDVIINISLTFDSARLQSDFKIDVNVKEKNSKFKVSTTCRRNNYNGLDSFLHGHSAHFKCFIFETDT